jgi:hypothetical protein
VAASVVTAQKVPLSPRIAVSRERSATVLEPGAEPPQRDAKQKDDESGPDECPDVVVVSDASNNESHHHHHNPCDQEHR